MSDVVIYGFAMSTYVRTACMACVEKRVDYTLEGFEFRSPVHGDLHPFFKMPAAKIMDKRWFETLAIVTAIDALPGDSLLLPPQGNGLARCLQWVSIANDYGYRDLVQHTMDENPDPEIVVNAMTKILVLLNHQLTQTPFLAGDKLTAADLFFYPMLDFARAKVGKFPSLIKEQRHLSDWLTSLTARPSAIQTAIKN